MQSRQVYILYMNGPCAIRKRAVTDLKDLTSSFLQLHFCRIREHCCLSETLLKFPYTMSLAVHDSHSRPYHPWSVERVLLDRFLCRRCQGRRRVSGRRGAVWDMRSTKPMKVFQTDKSLGPGSSGRGRLWASGAAAVASGWNN